MPGRFARLSAILAAATFLAALASLAPGSPAAGTCAAAGSHHAAVVVEHGDGSVVTRCVSFDAAEITGEQLLNLSGIAWSSQTFGGFGDAVCAVDSEPARYATCLGKDDYWAVFSASGGGTWRLANVGISSVVIHDGDAEGFRYVPAVGTVAAPVSPAGVCAGAAPRATVRASLRPASATPTALSAVDGATASATDSTATAAARAVAAATANPSAAAVPAAVAPGRTPNDRAPVPPAGLDFGLLIAAVAGGSLAGLALLRLLAGRRLAR